MKEIDHLIETVNHGMTALRVLAEKYGDAVEWRSKDGEWQKLTAEVTALDHIEFRIKQK